MISGSADLNINVWEVESWKIIKTFVFAHKGGVNSVGFSSDNLKIVSGGGDDAIKIWSI